MPFLDYANSAFPKRPTSYIFPIVLGALAIAGCAAGGFTSSSPTAPLAARSASRAVAPASLASPLSIDTKAIFNILNLSPNDGDGENPYAGPFFDKKSGSIFGAAQLGGPSGDGVVFALTDPGYKESSAHIFAGAPDDGRGPKAALIDPGDKGVLFGTTTHGGSGTCSDGCGTVYALTPGPAGYHESFLYSFAGMPSDGADPIGGVAADASGNLYGATNAGGKYGDGAIYKLTRSGDSYSERLLYSFGSKTQDGVNPVGPVLVFDGHVYGTTEKGGRYGEGEVFRISTGGSGEASIYPFGGQRGITGQTPLGNLTVDPTTGTLYGTTSRGGMGCANGCGIIYSLAANTWIPTILHNFAGSPGDGAVPVAGLLSYGGLLYGTTSEGGNGQCPGNKDGFAGCGTLFAIDPSGSGYTKLGDFQGSQQNGTGPLGLHPTGSLTVDDSGIIYGTTDLGGPVSDACFRGCGTVFDYPTGMIYSRRVFRQSATPAETLRR